MSSTKPTILLIPGGWHTPASYNHLTQALNQKGYNKVHIPHHPSVTNTRPPTSDLITDTTSLETYVQDLCNKNHKIIAIMHSYGGQVGTNCLGNFTITKRSQQNLPGGVIQLIYMTASALSEGQSQVDLVRQFNHMDFMPVVFDFADDMSVLCRDPKTTLIGTSDMKPVTSVSESEIETYLSTLVRWNGKCMYQPITLSAWKQDIPVGYVYCTRDMTIPYEYQKAMVEGMRREGKVVDTVEIETGHCPNFTATEEVIEALEGLINNAARRGGGGGDGGAVTV